MKETKPSLCHALSRAGGTGQMWSCLHSTYIPVGGHLEHRQGRTKSSQTATNYKRNTGAGKLKGERGTLSGEVGEKVTSKANISLSCTLPRPPLFLIINDHHCSGNSELKRQNPPDSLPSVDQCKSVGFHFRYRLQI